MGWFIYASLFIGVFGVSGEMDSRDRYNHSNAEEHDPDCLCNFDMENDGKVGTSFHHELYEHRGFEFVRNFVRNFSEMNIVNIFSHEPEWPNKQVVVEKIMNDKNNGKIMERYWKNNENKEVVVKIYCVHWNCEWYASAVGDAAEVNRTPRGLDTSRPLSKRPRVCGAGGNNPCGGWPRPAPCHESRPNTIDI